ncbi:MAG: ArsA family ATPase [Agathobacter sp.]|nr:ArsA family ATPase [Agathobacter sp.]
MRIIIYTGKGGVGKTSMAAATASKLASEGKKVLIMSTDQAHSLGDSFDMPMGKEPVFIAQNLYGMEIDTIYEGEKAWGNLKGYFKKLLTIQSESDIEVEELLVFPGLEELFSMFKILEMYEKNEYDTIIVDCAPTGETLALLKYPEKLSGFIEKVLPIKRKGVKTAGPIIEKTMKIPMPGEEFFDDFEYIMDRMGKLQNLMLNKDIVSIRIVTTPEQIVLTEAKRNCTCLYLYNYNVDAILVNKVYPKQAMEGYFSQWIKQQEKSIREIKESFSEIPCFYVELQQKELRTLPVLQEIGNTMYGKYNPDDILFKENIYKIDTSADTLSIFLPFADKGEMKLEQSEEELIVGVKNEVRRFFIPKEFRDKEIGGAKFEEGYLKIKFL